MLAWRHSNRLQGSPDIYQAALCHDVNKAEQAFARWIDSHQPDDIEYFSQKPLSLAWNRHASAFQSHANAGVFTNIRRQAQLRAYANALLLPTLLETVPEIPVIGLGEVYARWQFGAEQANHLDHLDLAVRRQDLPVVCKGATTIGFVQSDPAIESLYRPATVVNMRCSKRNVSLKLIGLHRRLPPLDAVAELDKLMVLPYDAHLKFGTSVMAGLLRRPDQLLFDVATMIGQPDRYPNALAVLSRRPRTKRLIRQIIGI